MKDIYDQTHFSIIHSSDIIDFTIDTLPLDAPLDKAFAILTAWNPNNQPLSLQDNTVLHTQLFSYSYKETMSLMKHLDIWMNTAKRVIAFMG